MLGPVCWPTLKTTILDFPVPELWTNIQIFLYGMGCCCQREVSHIEYVPCILNSCKGLVYQHTIHEYEGYLDGISA